MTYLLTNALLQVLNIFGVHSKQVEPLFGDCEDAAIIWLMNQLINFLAKFGIVRDFLELDVKLFN